MGVHWNSCLSDLYIFKWPIIVSVTFNYFIVISAKVTCILFHWLFPALWHALIIVIMLLLSVYLCSLIVYLFFILVIIAWMPLITASLVGISLQSIQKCSFSSNTYQSIQKCSVSSHVFPSKWEGGQDSVLEPINTVRTIPGVCMLLYGLYK